MSRGLRPHLRFEVIYMGAYKMRPSHASHFDVYKLDTSLA